MTKPKRRKLSAWAATRWVVGAIFRFAWHLVTFRLTMAEKFVTALLVAFIIAFETVSPMNWLSLAMYYEARDEGIAGRLAVANVVFNRVEDSRWPSTVYGVVDDGRERGRLCDFSFMCDGKPENPWLHNRRYWGKWIAVRVEAYALYLSNMAGLRYDNTDGAVFYKRYDVESPWFDKEIAAGRMIKIEKDLGSHEFFK